MASKCKTVAKTAGKIFGGSKRKAEAIATEAPEVEEDEEESMQQDEEEEITEKQQAANKKRQEKDEEKEAVAKREKELKSMYVDDLKKLVESLGLQTCKRDDMMKAVLKHEAKERADAREKEARIRDVVLQKKEEFEAMAAPELKKLCTSAGFTGSLSKSERIEKLLTEWLQNDGVAKTLQKKAHEQRETELLDMDKQALRKLCEKASVDPFLQDVLIDRIVRHETTSGAFLKPTVPAAPEAEPTATSKKTNMVEALLAKERENEEMAAKQAAEAEVVAKRIKELKAKSIDELKKLLKRKGLDTSISKKEEMVRVLYDATVEDEALVARKSELKSMDKDALSKLLSARGLEASGSKEKIVDAIMNHETNIRKEMKVFEAKVIEASAKKREELEESSGAELKDMCAKKGLAVGGANEDKINRLIEAAQKDGDIDTIVVQMNRDARRQALSAMQKSELVKLCETLDVDALVKEVMVERILSHEAESGEPIAKKARK